jgi:16S rRNA (guanine(966)-N(2))-methyltransferase RsmD
VRDALFNRLGGAVADAAVLDLFAGTGALGIEALHRGARRAVFVERDPAQARAIRGALRRAGYESRAAIRLQDALAAVEALGRSGETFDLVLLDPPYGQGWLSRSLAALERSRIVSPGGIVVAEGHWRDRPEVGPGVVVEREARYGETALWFCRFASVR